jgi:hypothetical protein
MVLVTISTGWRRWSGLFFTALILGAVFWTFRYPGNSYHPYPITEARAARIQQAIEHYHDRTWSYPNKLSSLVPLELLRVSRPMIMTGQGWCYESGPDYYRLGTIFREHWSAPDLSVRIYASAGTLPDTGWVCDERLAQLKQKR